MLVSRLLKSVLRPRIGSLYHYSPRPMRVIDAPVHSTDSVGTLPSFSIVTPSYQQGQFIESTLKSVVSQGYERLQYVVQDGGSTDETTAVLTKYSDSLCYWESRADGGQTAALNLGFARTDGEIMAYLNSDDLLLPHCLRTVGAFFAANPEVDVVYGDRILIDENGSEVGAWRLPGHDDGILSWADYVPQETLFWRRRIWDRAGATFDESFQFAMDWDLILRFRACGATFKHLPIFLGAFRTHSSQKSSALIHSQGQREMDRLRHRSLGYMPTGLQVSRAVRLFLVRHVLFDFPHRMHDWIHGYAVARGWMPAKASRR